METVKSNFVGRPSPLPCIMERMSRPQVDEVDAAVPQISTASMSRRIRETFAAASFTEERLTEVLDAKDVASAYNQGIPSLLYRTRGGSPVETLLRLFVIGANAVALSYGIVE